MRYRTFGRLDFRPSALGFGAMRLPVLDDDPARIDEPEAVRMIRRAIDGGVNYIDSAYPYHRGNSEALVGKALKGGYRERVKVATKSPVWLLEKPDDFDRYLDEQLARLDAGPIDFYLLHGLDQRRWASVTKLGVLGEAEKALADGRIRHLGFSFHDSLETFRAIIDGYDGWEFCQIQYNYMDASSQAGREGLVYAASRGLGVVVMEPIRGGSLADLPSLARAVFDQAHVRRTPAEWALRWVWNQPEVSLVLSGMSTMEQVEENLASADRSGPGTLTPEELALYDQVRERVASLGWIPCTGCSYCLPCPHGVLIPEQFSLYNDTVPLQRLQRGRRSYGRYPAESRADACLECGECRDKCPQHLDIPSLLAKAHAALGPERQ